MELTVFVPNTGWQRNWSTDAQRPSNYAEVEAFTDRDGTTVMLSQEGTATPVVDGIYRDGEQITQGAGTYAITLAEGDYNPVPWGVTP